MTFLDLPQIIPPNPIEKFLGTVLFQNSFFILDLWMFAHLFAGLLFAFHKGLKWWVVFLILFVYECFEWLFLGIAFRPEGFVGVFWDMFFGMFGFFVFRWFFPLSEEKLP